MTNHYMRYLILTMGMALLCFGSQAQEDDYTRRLIDKAIAEHKEAPKRYDSLRKVFKTRWTIGLVYGQRFMLESSTTKKMDTVTFTDFSKRRFFFGLEGGYFVSPQLHLSAGIDLLILPKNQEISTFNITSNHIQIEGKGSGGMMYTFGLGARYSLIGKGLTRPYLGLEIGVASTVAKGGEVRFSNGQMNGIITRKANYQYFSPSLGINHRMSPSCLIDFNLSYLHSNRSENVGSIISINSISTTLTLQIIPNAKK